MKYFKKLQGNHIYLSPVYKGDASLYAKWMNDEEIMRNLHIAQTMTNEETAIAMLDHIIQTKQPSFEIVLKENDLAIGSIAFTSLNALDQTATIGMYIGEKEYRNCGYGTEALHLMVQYGFNQLHLHNINLSVFSFNLSAIKCYKKVGFKEYGRRHECAFIDGKYYDRISMELLVSEYQNHSLTKV